MVSNINSVLIICRDEAVIDQFEEKLSASGYDGEINYAHDVPEIKSVLQTKKPDIIFIEVCFFEHSIYKHIFEFSSRFPRIRFVAFAWYPYKDRQINNFVKSGADSYVSFRKKPDYIVGVLKKIISGETFVPDLKIHHKSGIDIVADFSDVSLGDRELELMTYIAHDMNIQEIMVPMALKEQTIRNMLNKIYKKTGTRSMVGVTRFMLLNGYLDRAEYCGCENCKCKQSVVVQTLPISEAGGDDNTK